MTVLQALQRFSCTAVVVAGLCACSESDAPGGSSASATSLALVQRLNTAPAADSEAVVVWTVTSGSPDYAYVWGRADVQGSSFNLRLQAPPPAEAINSYGLGVGIVLIVPTSARIRDGKQTDADEKLFAQAVGASERHAILYVEPERTRAAIEAMASKVTAEELQRAREHWLFDFPAGYSCGAARQAAAGETFDSFAPEDCNEVQIRSGALDDFEFPNWT